MSELATTILASMTASGAVVAVLAWLSREWISTRLRGAIQHEYDQKLESLKAKLKAESDVTVVGIRAALERDAALIAAAHGSFAEGQKAAMERKLQAVDLVWGRILQLRASLPPVLAIVDVLDVQGYAAIKDQPTFTSLMTGWSVERIGQLFDTEVERARPYVGEYVWAVLYSYQAVMLRIVFLLFTGKSDAAKLEWYKESGTRQIIQAVLSPEEFVLFEATPFGKVSWIQARFEGKILSATRRLISGEDSGSEALDQARLIQEKVIDMERSNKQMEPTRR